MTMELLNGTPFVVGFKIKQIESMGQALYARILGVQTTAELILLHVF